MLIYKKRLFLFMLLIFLLAWNNDIKAPGPDAQLYHSLAQQLVNGESYEDQLRKDEIIPPIGHPVILFFPIKLGIRGDFYEKTMFSFSFVLFFGTCCMLGLGMFVSFLFVLSLNALLPFGVMWGIETSLLFSLSLLFYSFVLFLKNTNIKMASFFSLSLLLFVIVRPILLPFITLIFGVTLIYALEHKEARRVLFTLIFVFTVPFASLSLFSQYKFNDARLISGTYSEISLFCAWNDFLPLTRHYNSGLWKKLPEVEYETALKILHNDSGWEMRAVKLRKEVLKFIISNPMKACKGYIWRLGKFSINVDNSSKLYKLLFIAWSLTAILVILFSLQMMVFKEKITFCIVTLLPSFIILVTALFSFIGNRYYLTPGFSLLFALAFNIAILKGETSAGRCLLKI